MNIEFQIFVSFYDVITFPFWIVRKRNDLIMLLVILFIFRTRRFVFDGKVSEGSHFIYFVLQAKVTRNSWESVGVNLLEKYAVYLRTTGSGVQKLCHDFNRT
jgi:hypothetical protein